MANENYFNKIKESIAAYAVEKNYSLSDSDVTDAITKAVEDVYGSVGRKATLVCEEGSVNIISHGDKKECPLNRFLRSQSLSI